MERQIWAHIACKLNMRYLIFRDNNSTIVVVLFLYILFWPLLSHHTSRGAGLSTAGNKPVATTLIPCSNKVSAISRPLAQFYGDSLQDLLSVKGVGFLLLPLHLFTWSYLITYIALVGVTVDVGHFGAFTHKKQVVSIWVPPAF